jgi:hypothetical protein
VTRELVIDSGKRKAMSNGRNATVWICPEFTYPQKSLAFEV